MWTSFVFVAKTSVKVLIKPGEKAFAAEQGRASVSLSAALFWILLVNAVAILLSIQGKTMFAEWVQSGQTFEWYPPSLYERVLRAYGEVRILSTFLYLEIVKSYAGLWFHSRLLDLVGSTVYAIGTHFLVDVPIWQQNSVRIILSPTLFLVKAGAYHFIATLLGGRGRFRHYVFFLVAIGVPTSLLRSVLKFLPYAGGRVAAIYSDSSFVMDQDWYYGLSLLTSAIAILVTVYWIVLFYFVTKTEYHISWWRAAIAVAVSYATGFAIGTIPSYAFLGLMEAVRLYR